MKNTLKVERARHDLTQEALAKAIGVSRQTIVAIERGDYLPSTVLALKLARYFAVTVEQIFSLEASD
jgi:putative transcriptional regulator